MKIQFYYTKDKDGRIDISIKTCGKGTPPIKDFNLNQWQSPKDTHYRWVKVSELKDYDDSFSVFPFIKDALKDLPEPSWEDEVPMLVTLDIQCTNINYSYVE